jgi:hypothetical protein
LEIFTIKVSGNGKSLVFSIGSVEVLSISLVFYEGVADIKNQSNGPYIMHLKSESMEFMKFGDMEVRKTDLSPFMKSRGSKYSKRTVGGGRHAKFENSESSFNYPMEKELIDDTIKISTTDAKIQIEIVFKPLLEYSPEKYSEMSTSEQF